MNPKFKGELYSTKNSGSLFVFEKNRLPFKPKRIFFVHDVPIGTIRGNHAHLKCHQFLIVLSGEIEIGYNDGSQEKKFKLKSPEVGVHIPNLTWSFQKTLSTTSTLCVLASEHYHEDDYIYDYLEFKKILNSR